MHFAIPSPSNQAQRPAHFATLFWAELQVNTYVHSTLRLESRRTKDPVGRMKVVTGSLCSLTDTDAQTARSPNVGCRKYSLIRCDPDVYPETPQKLFLPPSSPHHLLSYIDFCASIPQHELIRLVRDSFGVVGDSS